MNDASTPHELRVFLLAHEGAVPPAVQERYRLLRSRGSPALASCDVNLPHRAVFSIFRNLHPSYPRLIVFDRRRMIDDWLSMAYGNLWFDEFTAPNDAEPRTISMTARQIWWRDIGGSSKRDAPNGATPWPFDPRRRLIEDLLAALPDLQPIHVAGVGPARIVRLPDPSFSDWAGGPGGENRGGNR